METEVLLDRLLAIGRSGRFADIVYAPGAGNHASVLSITDHGAKAVLAFCRALDNDGRIAFIKALAVYESTVGGLGSVTTIQDLLPIVDDPKRELLEWILANTRAYWYYGRGATSVSELDAINNARVERRAESLHRERSRELAAKEHKAASATIKLFNAVRRGDSKAVKALLAAGADPNVKTPDGSSLQALASASGHQDIALELEDAQRVRNAP